LFKEHPDLAIENLTVALPKGNAANLAGILWQSTILPPNYYFELHITESSSKVLASIESDTVTLGDIAEAYFGIQTFDRKAYVANSPITTHFRPVIDGGNVFRYRLLPHSDYVDFRPQNVKSGGNKDVYANERIVVRQIGKYPEGTLVPPGLLTLNTIYNLYLEDRSFTLKFILAARGKASDQSADRKMQTRWEPTTLDRVHAARLLQASGRANALRALLESEQERGPDFLRLANALSALYPKDAEEKRLLDAMLLAVPR
jgi:TaqI-like C-terminal specificity domain